MSHQKENEAADLKKKKNRCVRCRSTNCLSLVNSESRCRSLLLLFYLLLFFFSSSLFVFFFIYLFIYLFSLSCRFYSALFDNAAPAASCTTLRTAPLATCETSSPKSLLTRVTPFLALSTAVSILPSYFTKIG